MNMKNNKTEVRPPSLGDFKESITEMMEMRSGKRPKKIVKKRVLKSIKMNNKEE